MISCFSSYSLNFQVWCIRYIVYFGVFISEFSMDFFVKNISQMPLDVFGIRYGNLREIIWLYTCMLLSLIFRGWIGSEGT